MSVGLIARLEKRASEWDAQVDGWLKQAEDAGQKVGAETERVMRDTIYREAADEIKRLRAGLEDISEGRCIVDWAHKAEKQFEAFAEDVLAGCEVRLMNCASCDGAGCDLYGGNPQRDCTVCNGRGKVPLTEGAE